ncbi:DUF6633 family protein [Flavisolibacter ginsenosidimutans]|uniref:Uncharacterized protein n=1 Tax=Flavisolibacter ginsenosidimutans TaxID=661481 RepID=A0A5B8UPJ0_9BACT|nr:DUF6633 family protein [Flavisolibacter ginsenosidimutans]QEC58366.1 hypothetical protein FSB75_21475 [Flavisolibacter ginsenosidimutans]
MNSVNNVVTMEPQGPVVSVPRKRFVRSLEYEIIANLAKNQYTNGEEVLFERLLSIPLAERVPGLINDYGLQRAHRLIKMLLQEFCYGIPLPKSAKLSDTKIAACACDLILASYEDQLSLEDLVVFLEKAKEGKYGKFKGVVTHFGIMQKLEQYRNDRSETYFALKEEQERKRKEENEIPRIGEVRSIGEIMQQAEVIDMTKRKSG